MTPAQANLLRATALLSQVPASGVLREGVREALAVVDAETARGLNAPRRFCDTVAARAAIDPAFREEIEAAQPVGLFAQLMPEQQRQALEYRGDELIGPRCGPAPVDSIVAEVRADLLARSEVGIAKYGVTLDRKDLGLREWLEHAYFETLDNGLYLKRAMREIAKEGDPWPERYAAAVAVLQAERDRLQVMMANGGRVEIPRPVTPEPPDTARLLATGWCNAQRAAAAPVEPPHAAASALRPLAPEPPAAVLGRATEALAWDGQQLPVHVPFNPAVKHPYGDDAYQMTTDGVARMFPNREAAHRWLAAMGKAA